MTTPEPTDEALIERFCAGDEEAFEALIQRYRSRLLRLGIRFTGEREEAEEVIQEVCLILCQKLSQFEGKSAFSTWLYRIAVNTALMRIRGRGQAELVSLEGLADDQFMEDESATNPDGQLFTEQSLGKIEKVLVHLPEDMKTVVVLRDIEGFSNEETAEIMGISVAAVKSRVHRARGFLRLRLEDLYRETVEG